MSRARSAGVTKVNVGNPGVRAGKSSCALTPKEQRFVEEYVIDWNASDAARRAGYATDGKNNSGPRSDVALRQNASRLLRRQPVRKAIERRLKQLSDESLVAAAAARVNRRAPDLFDRRAESYRADAVTPQSLSRNVTARLRAEVMERDGFRCRRCGATPAEERLVVDHIVPVGRGGTADTSNLQTLCEPCNAGKSDREPHPHDFLPLEAVR